ncbi:MAG TPA: 5'-nucleotidase C-terminal domain-containing protein, partial [Anaerolineaceae bacterium]|nr:5'-nucleotidase C-terminal domain-containing protein [Anaerolineaceae bacterium]
AAAGLGIDVIIGGHSHTLLPEGEWVDGVLIAQTGQYAENLGRVDLVIDTETGAVLSKSAVVIPIPADTQPDPAVLAAIQSAETEARELLDKPIVEITERLGLDHFAECAIANLGADALLDRMHAEVALLTSGLFNQPLEAGTLTLGALDAACFTTANPQLSLVRGEQLLAGLEHGLDPDFMQQRLKMFRGAPVGMPVIAGMVVEYAPSAETGQRVRRAWVQGQALEPQRLYRIAHTDAEVHRENSEYGYLDLDEGQVLKVEVPTILREAIEDYMRAHAPVRCPPSDRWIPV